jgi:hypothetical protein
MSYDKSREYAGITAVSGVRLTSYPSLPDVNCPICASAEVAYLLGKVTFAAKMNGEDLLDGESQPLAAFICPQSHIFFLREQDVIPSEPLRAA